APLADLAFQILGGRNHRVAVHESNAAGAGPHAEWSGIGVGKGDGDVLERYVEGFGRDLAHDSAAALPDVNHAQHQVHGAVELKARLRLAGIAPALGSGGMAVDRDADAF